MKTSCLNKLSLLIITAYCLLLTAYCCEAGTISITTDAITWVEAGRIHGKIQVTNVGNAPAHELRADTEILGERFGSSLAPTLGPHESTSFQFSKPVDPSLKGTYPLVVLIHFQDANRHPFTALSCSTFSIGEKVDAGLSATAETLDLKDDGTLHFEIRNESDQPRQVRATLHLPREISCPNPIRDVEVAPHGKKGSILSRPESLRPSRRRIPRVSGPGVRFGAHALHGILQCFRADREGRELVQRNPVVLGGRVCLCFDRFTDNQPPTSKIIDKYRKLRITWNFAIKSPLSSEILYVIIAFFSDLALKRRLS